MDSSPVAAGRRRRLRRAVRDDGDEEANLQTSTKQKSQIAVPVSVPKTTVPPKMVNEESRPAKTSKRLQRVKSDSESKVNEHASGMKHQADRASEPVPDSQPALSKPVRHRPPRAAAAQFSATPRWCEEEASTENDDEEESECGTTASLLRRPRRARRSLQQVPEPQLSKSRRQQQPSIAATRCFLEEEASDESDDEDMQLECSTTGSLAAPRRSQRLQARSNAPPASLAENADYDRKASQGHRKQTKVPAARANSFLADSDAEESSGDGAKALSHSITSSRGGVEKRGRKRIGFDLGTDEDPEVDAWSQDLEDRWLNSSEPRPTAAFSKEAPGLEALRKLPPANFLAGCPVFDDFGKVNIPWLLGAHRKLVAELHAGGGDTTKTRSPAARQVGWLARKALSLGLIDDAQLKSGRLGRSQSGIQPPAKRSRSCPDFLPAEQEIRFPVRPGTTRSMTGGLDDGLEEAAAEDDVERFIKRRQAMAALKSRNDGRQAQIGARSSHHVDMKDVAGKILAPGFSFDWTARDGESEDESGDQLEVALPKEEPRSTSRRMLLKDQLQKKVRMVMAKGLTINETVLAASPVVSTAATQAVQVKLESAPAAMPSVPTASPQTTGEELELEVEDEPPPDRQLHQVNAFDDEDETQPLERRRRRHRRLVVDEEGDDEAEPAVPADQPSESGKTNSASDVLRAAGPAIAAPKPRKQVRLDEMFAAKVCKTQPEEAQVNAEVAEVSPQEKCLDAHQESDVAVCPRPLKRLRQGVFTETVFEDYVDDKIALPREETVEIEETLGRMQGSSDSRPELDELDEASCAEHSSESEVDGSDAEGLELFDDEGHCDGDLNRRCRNILRRRRLEVASAQRRLRWEVEDAADFENRNDLIKHLGTSTMNSSDRDRWEREMLHSSSSSISPKSSGHQGSDKKMIWARGDDDAQQLYGLGVQRGRKSSFLGKAHSSTMA